VRTEQAEKTRTARSDRGRRVRRIVSAVAVLAAAVSAIDPSTLQAQQPSLASGRVVVADTAPLSGARVLLHRVARDVQGPIDSALADRRGRFRFRFQADTAALYLLSVRYDGIEYFSTPVRASPGHPDTSIRLVAYDTSSTVPVGVEARHLVVPRAGETGARSVLDLIVLKNEGRFARVSPDSAHPSWSVRLPAGAGEMEVGQSDVSPDAVVRDGDTVRVLAPIAPGQKQLSLEYAVAAPDGRVVFDVGSSDSPLNVLVEEPGARVTGGTLALVDSQVIEGRRFRRWTGRVPAGGSVTVAFAGRIGSTPRGALIALIVPVAAVLGFAAWRLLRRPRAAATAPAPDALLDAIAALDARYLGREAETPTEEWSRYETERAALKARLEDALASGPATRYV
jgi:hypothetical protein